MERLDATALPNLAAATQRDQVVTMSRVVAQYIYRDGQGRPRFRKVRLEPKDFRLGSYLGLKDGRDRWAHRIVDGDVHFYLTALYGLPEVNLALKTGQDIWWTEGEKDCEAVRSLGLTATTTALSAEGTLLDHAMRLARFGQRSRVHVVADVDLAGAHSALERLTMLGHVDVRSRVIAPPVGFNDAHDAIEAGLSLCDFRPVPRRSLERADRTYWATRRRPYTDRATRRTGSG
jgi:hypothetical protein